MKDKITNKEAIELINLYRLTKDQKYKEKLISSFLGVVYFQAKKYENINKIELEDLIQEGLMGLNMAIETFDASLNYRFGTYATKCIVNQIYQYLRKEMKYSEEDSIYADIFAKSESDHRREDNQPITEGFEDKVIDSMIYEEQIGMVKKFIRTKLAKPYSDIILLRYFNGDKVMKPKEINAELGLNLSDRDIYSKIYCGIRKLRRCVAYERKLTQSKYENE